jgi:hypothetical protein
MTMSPTDLARLRAAWQLIDDRVKRIQERHTPDDEIPLYDSGIRASATDEEIAQLRSFLHIEPPWELVESLRMSNGRWIAHDHVIELSSSRDYEYMFKIDADFQRRANAGDKKREETATFEEVVGPINMKMNSKRRICFAGHERSGGFLYLDFENPPADGRMGQVIRIGEDPRAEFIAPSFIDFLELVAAAPLCEDDPDLDPLLPRP